MITTKQYFMGRDDTHPLDMTPQIEHDALITIDLANRFVTLAKGAGVLIHETANWGLVASGWRPPSVNSATKGASPTSKHMVGQAIDLYDPDGQLGRWAYVNTNILKDLGLWMESPAHTPTWLHLQTKPPYSGNRVFQP